VGTARRRIISISGVVTLALVLTVALPLWLPIAVVLDLVRLRPRLPVSRLLVFALGWSWLETIGVAAAAALWLTGRGSDSGAHHRLQRWWAANLMRVLRASTGLRVEVHGAEAMVPGPAVVLCRHASLADSLLSAWVITGLARQHPRYVLKRELLFDPCLDVVGGRVPNHFLDREAPDSSVELARLTELAAGMGEREVTVIFPEGTRATAAKRARALAKIAERDAARAEALSALQHLLPPRPAGAIALIEGCPTADVVLAWHTGFDGLDTFGGILRALGRSAPTAHFEAVRIARADVPTGPPLASWLDQQWLLADREVDRLLTSASPTSPTSPTDRS
jgi:1-acyl-sn-glycerol-3-phosphate acyltransferase